MRNQKEPPEIKKLLEFKASLVQKACYGFILSAKVRCF